MAKRKIAATEAVVESAKKPKTSALKKATKSVDPTKPKTPLPSALKKTSKPAQAESKPQAPKASALKKKSAKVATSAKKIIDGPETIQVVAGSYDRVLHGFTVTIQADGQTDFADSFLFNAHTSALRCVAISPISAPVPGQGQKVFLASGSTDERINVYNLSAHPPSMKKQDMLAKVAPRPIRENSKNRELGTLLHHSSSVTSLSFPTRSKLLSASEDSTIGVTRTRDWSLLSSVKAPIAKPAGRPSGDTAPFGGTPAGVNDFAVHPSMKVMISVSKSERCMRLWNLVTGKKAGVLNFDKKLLQEAGESKHSTGEGRKVVWGNVDGEDEFAVGFDRDLIVFGMDSTPKCRLMLSLRTKVHHFDYIEVDDMEGGSLLAVSTEDGRIMLFSTRQSDIKEPEDGKQLGLAKLVGFLGGKEQGVTSRVKDFSAVRSDNEPGSLYFIGGSSDGKARLWKVTGDELKKAVGSQEVSDKPFGKLMGTYETQNRITCMAAFMMIPRPEGVEDSDDEIDDLEDDDDDDDEDSE